MAVDRLEPFDLSQSPCSPADSDASGASKPSAVECASAGDLKGGDCSLMTLAPRPLAPYEAMPLPMLDDQQLERIVQRHGLRLDGPIIPLHSSGVVHSLWALGSQLVLRVPKNEPMSLGDHRCESVAIPLALLAGVRTPDLAVFDELLTILDVPFSIVERIDGYDLAAAPFVKPDNVMVDCVGRTHPIDWGDAGFGNERTWTSGAQQRVHLRSFVVAQAVHSVGERLVPIGGDAERRLRR